MRVFRNVIVASMVFIAMAVLALWATDNEHVLYGIRKTYLIGKKKPDIDDMLYFDVRKVTAGSPSTLYLSAFNPQKIRANPKVIEFYKSIPKVVRMIF
jgi:hypothetical protein